MFHEREHGTGELADIAGADLLCFMRDIPALLWRVEIPRSRIEFFNDFKIDELGENTSLFIKSLTFRNMLLLPKDKQRVDAFFEEMKERKSSSTVFRIAGKSGALRWLKLCGVHSSCNSDFYHGTLSDVTDTAAVVARVAEEELNEKVHVERGQNVEACAALSPVVQQKKKMVDALHKARRELVQQGDIDSVIFSDVHIRRDRVAAYFSGDVFDTAVQGEVFSFKGTIAQDMKRYGLDYMVVDDTLNSIKTIDWALFVPLGIRSYYAKPYYVRGVLRSILIICSNKPRTFKGKMVNSYDDVLEPLVGFIRNWRKECVE